MILLLGLTLGFHLRMGLGVLDSLFTAFLLATLPVLGLAQLPFLVGAELERLRAYAGSAMSIVTMASVALVLGALGPGLGAMGLGATPWLVLGRTVAALVVGAALLVGLFQGFMRLTGVRESPVMERLLPRTGPERRVFAVLSVVAGLGEEVVYRGYLLALLTPVLGGPWTAAGASSVAFGILHAYQGPLGIVRTAALGFMFAASLVLTGTLWPAVVVHTLVDLVGGLWEPPHLAGRRG